MCGGKAPKDNSAEIARQNEEARQARIMQGQKSIEDTFANTFNDDYFNNLTRSYEEYYNPQLKDQFDSALKELTFQTARSGNAESTAANELFAKAEKQKQDAATQITNDALAATGKAKANVAAQKSNLFSLNNAAADPTQASSQAAQAAVQLDQPQSFSPLGSIFAGLINTGNTANAINQATSPQGFSTRGPSAPPPTTSSSISVRGG